MEKGRCSCATEPQRRVVTPPPVTFATGQIDDAELAGAVGGVHLQRFGKRLQGVEVIGSAPEGDAGTGGQIKKTLQQIGFDRDFLTGYFELEKLGIRAIFVRLEVIGLMTLWIGAEPGLGL